ncbi:MAG: 7-cyano-7-deazaguanine synthase QueC [Gimesia sp.]|nr:7-cyano-7-deazaguanine synthase QueC [Gimesia sp.]
MSNAIVLLSGGMDSAVSLEIAKAQGFQVSALSFKYGQRHGAELNASSKIAEIAGVVEHIVMDIDLRAFGQSALTDQIAVPKDRTLDEMNSRIPVTYVPARNTIFLSFALAFAEVRQAYDIFIGVNALDYNGYPDCRPEYITAFQAMANLATAQAVNSGKSLTIHTPLIKKSKTEIIKLGTELGVDFSETVSCYEANSNGQACGHCDACVLRRSGFNECGIQDPTIYINEKVASS